MQRVKKLQVYITWSKKKNITAKLTNPAGPKKRVEKALRKKYKSKCFIGTAWHD